MIAQVQSSRLICIRCADHVLGLNPDAEIGIVFIKRDRKCQSCHSLMPAGIMNTQEGMRVVNDPPEHHAPMPKWI